MKKVLMVCLGNICRSPLAEGILKSKVSSQDFMIDSAGTGGYHIGNPPDKRSIEIAKKYDIDISNQRCRKFVVEDFDKFSIIYVMDISNYNDVISKARSEADIRKVKLIMDEVYPNEEITVPDPYYGGNQGFENVYKMLDNACDVIANKNL